MRAAQSERPIAIYASFLRNWARKPADEPLIKHGIDRWTIGMANALVREGAPVDLLVKTDRVDRARLNVLLDERVRVVPVGASRVASYWGLIRHQRRERPRAMIGGLHEANHQLLAIRRRLGLRTVLIATVHEHITSLCAAMSPTACVRYLSRLRNYDHADVVVSGSRGVSQDLVDRHGFDPQRLRTVFHPVAVPACDADDPACDARLAPGLRRILGVGRLCDQKGFDRLIDAFALLAEDPGLILTLCGGAPAALVEALRARVARHGLGARVEFAGHVAQIGCWYRSASVFVLSSRWEAPSLALIEALGCGTPVVSFDCPSGPREILDGGRFGTLVADGDVQGLAAAIRRTLDAPGEAQGRVARAAEFSPQHAARAYLDVVCAAEQALKEQAA